MGEFDLHTFCIFKSEIHYAPITGVIVGFQGGPHDSKYPWWFPPT
jgi:hypothetical protein